MANTVDNNHSCDIDARAIADDDEGAGDWWWGEEAAVEQQRQSAIYRCKVAGWLGCIVSKSSGEAIIRLALCTRHVV